MAPGMIPLEATAARQRVGSFRSRLKKQQPIMMSEPPTWGGATANPETLLRSLPTSVSSVDFPCNVAVTVHEFIDSNQEICDLWYDTIYWYKIYYLTFRFMCLGDLKLRISFKNFRDKSEADLKTFNANVQLNQPVLITWKWHQGWYPWRLWQQGIAVCGQLQKPTEKTVTIHDVRTSDLIYSLNGPREFQQMAFAVPIFSESFVL